MSINRSNYIQPSDVYKRADSSDSPPNKSQTSSNVKSFGEVLIKENQKVLPIIQQQICAPEKSKTQIIQSDFFKEEAQLQLPFKIPITNPKYFKNLDADANETVPEGQKSKRELLLEHLQLTFEKCSRRSMKSILNKSLLNKVHQMKHDQDLFLPKKHRGYVEIRQTDAEATKWLDEMDKEDADPDKIMQEYRDNVMLRQVFSLKDHQNNILETPLSQKFLAAKNPLHFGERYRNINVIKKDMLYYIIVDDTTEVKAHQNIETQWTASLSIHSFYPKRTNTNNFGLKSQQNQTK